MAAHNAKKQTQAQKKRQRTASEQALVLALAANPAQFKAAPQQEQHHLDGPKYRAMQDDFGPGTAGNEPPEFPWFSALFLTLTAIGIIAWAAANGAS